MKKYRLFFIVFTIIVSFSLSFLFELVVFNRNVIGKKSLDNVKIINNNDVDYKNDRYITTSKKAYFVLDTQNHYINNIKFDYNSNKNFSWKIVYLNESEDEVIMNFDSSLYLNKAIKKIGKNVDKLKIEINSKNIEISNFSIDNSIYLYWERIIVMTLIMSLIAILFKYRNYFIKNIDKAFFISSLVLGFSFILLTPKLVYNSFDDQIHFKNVINIFQKEEYNYSYAEQITLEGIDVRDTNFYSTRQEKRELYNYLNKIHEKKDNRSFISNKGSNYYKQLIYTPYWMGYKISNLFNLKYITSIIIAKLFNLIAYTILLSLAIKYAKYGKKIIFTIGLLPRTLFLASQFSNDPTIIASIIFASALFINMITEEKINKKSLLAFVLLIVWASLPKAIYCPMLLLLLFIKNDKFDNKKQALLFKILVIVLTLLLTITFVLPAASGSLTGDSRGGNTNGTEQLKLILSNPVFFAKVLARYTYINLFDNFLGIKNFVNLAYTINNSYIYPLYGFYLLFVCYVVFTSKKPDYNFNKLIKLACVLVIMAIWTLICTALYLSFTPVGSIEILGVQSRYFVPLLLLVFYLIMTVNKVKEENTTFAYYFVQIVMVSLVLGIVSLKIIG